jgi:hypothetical protein
MMRRMGESRLGPLVAGARGVEIHTGDGRYAAFEPDGLVVDRGAVEAGAFSDGPELRQFRDERGALRVRYDCIAWVQVHAPVHGPRAQLLADVVRPSLHLAPTMRGRSTSLWVCLMDGSFARWDLGRSPEKHSASDAHDVSDALLEHLAGAPERPPATDAVSRLVERAGLRLGEAAPGTPSRLHLLGMPEAGRLLAALDGRSPLALSKIFDTWVADLPDVTEPDASVREA